MALNCFALGFKTRYFVLVGFVCTKLQKTVTFVTRDLGLCESVGFYNVFPTKVFARLEPLKRQSPFDFATVYWTDSLTTLFWDQKQESVETIRSTSSGSDPRS